MNSINSIRIFIDKNRKIFLGILVFIFLTTFIFYLINWYKYIKEIPDEHIYFIETFDEGTKNWEGVDFSLEDDESDVDKNVNLSRKKYLAPHLMYKLPTEFSPPESYVFRFHVKVTSFSNDAVTLGTLWFSTGPIAIVADKNGRLGIGTNLFSQPIYASKSAKVLEKDKWNIIDIQFDNKSNKYILYLNGNKIMSNDYLGETYPVQEIWLGTVWVKGAGNYGVPTNISYDNIILANEGILKKPSFFKYIFNYLSK